jgi:hypothetical protein
MMGLLIFAIIIFALVKRRRYQHRHLFRRRDKWSRQWDRWVQNNQEDPIGEDRWAKWSQRWQEWESWARDGHHRVGDRERRAARRSESTQANREREAARTTANDGDASIGAGTHGSSTADRSSPRDDLKQARERNPRAKLIGRVTNAPANVRLRKRAFISI